MNNKENYFNHLFSQLQNLLSRFVFFICSIVFTENEGLHFRGFKVRKGRLYSNLKFKSHEKSLKKSVTAHFRSLLGFT